MTHRHMFIRPVFDRDTGGGTGAPANGDNRQIDNDTQPGGSARDTKQTQQDEPFEDFWNDEEEEETGDPGDRTSQDNRDNRDDNRGGGQNDDQINEFFNQRVPEMRETKEMREARENNDMEAFAEASNTAVRQQMLGMYRNMFVDMKRFVETRVESAIEDAVSRATTNVGAGQAVERMQSELKYTSDPAIAPMAKHVLGRALRKTNSVPQAIKMVDKYFESIGSKRSGKKSASGFNRGNNYPDNGNSDDLLDGETFDDLLGPANLDN